MEGIIVNETDKLVCKKCSWSGTLNEARKDILLPGTEAAYSCPRDDFILAIKAGEEIVLTEEATLKNERA